MTTPTEKHNDLATNVIMQLHWPFELTTAKDFMVIAKALATAEAEGLERAAKWHDEQSARLYGNALHKESASAIRALAKES